VEVMGGGVVAIDLRWVASSNLSWGGGGGCDEYESEVMWGCGGEVLMWMCWVWRRRCVVDIVCDWFSRYGIL
ncbi:hypothetical protein A2U01_0078077, partial [Trifolium medium]|nr:hypothetical protein [Trifolium medium]